MIPLATELIDILLSISAVCEACPNPTKITHIIAFLAGSRGIHDVNQIMQKFG